MKNLLDFVAIFDESDGDFVLSRDWGELVRLGGVGIGPRFADEALDRVLGTHLCEFL